MCYSHAGIYTRIKLWSKQCIMPSGLRLGILIILIGFIAMARVFIHTNYEEADMPADYSSTGIKENAQLDKEERKVLSGIYNVLSLSVKSGRKDELNFIYYQSLEKYLGRPGISLSSNETDKIMGKLKELNDILQFEKETEFTRMSLEGKNAAACILKQIYEKCGLQFNVDYKGKIGIKDDSGNYFYSNIKVHRTVFHPEALIITLFLILVLFSMSVIIAKKNQLFGRDVVYDGIDKEGFA